MKPVNNPSAVSKMRRPTVEPASEAPRGLGKAFAGLWGATAASNLGDGLVVVLLPLIALQLTDAPAAVAAVTVATTAAWPLFGLWAGLAVDSLDRRRLLLVVNGVRAAVLVALAVAWSADRLELPLLYAAALLLGAGETLADTTLTSMIPAVVPPERRGRANARIETTINLLNQLVGPPLAGALIGAGVAVAAGAAGASYAAALFGLIVVVRAGGSRPAAGERAEPGSWRSRTTAGMRALWRDTLLRRLTLMTAAMNLAWAAWTAVFVLYAVTPGPLGLTPFEYGLLLTGMAVGGLATAPAVDLLVRAIGVRSLLLLDLLGTVALVAPAALGWGAVPVAAGAVAAGAGSTVWRTIVSTVRQNRVDDALLGRVYAASRIVSWGVLPIGAAGAGVLAQAYDVRTALAAAAVLAAALVVAFGPLTRGFDLNAQYTGSQRALAESRNS